MIPIPENWLFFVPIYHQKVADNVNDGQFNLNRFSNPFFRNKWKFYEKVQKCPKIKMFANI